MHRCWDSLNPWLAAWEALLGRSAYASVYSTYDFCRLGWDAYHRHESRLFIVTMHDADALVAVLPMRLEDSRVAGIAHTRLLPVHLQEVDKPYPLIAAGYEIAVWRSFAATLLAHRQEWDIVNWPELPDDLPGVSELRRALAGQAWIRVETRPDAAGPLVDLNQCREAFQARHRRYRRALRRIRKQCKGPLRLALYSRPEEMDEALALFIRVEDRSWKAGCIGVNRNARARRFHEQLTQALAKRGRIVIAILFDGERPVSGEIAYLCAERVFFSHGAFDQDYAALSPGKISTGLFLTEFLGSGYRWGDFLAGFADYLMPWSDRTVTTTELFIYQLRPALTVLWAWRKLGLRRRAAGFLQRWRAADTCKPAVS
ncbi:GNAT family N-acetyltransferase [Granulosicoccaceae sp. 1_MG-2023]|nr:GNAT family N-acetyltransferase [Granulosicoccaceae sp. 1_MG-2023]